MTDRECQCAMGAMWYEGMAPICRKPFEELESGVDCCAHCSHSQCCHSGESEEEKQRTRQQQKAIEVYCRELAKALNNAGYDQKKVFAAMKEGVEIPWSQESCKESLFKPIMQAVLKKDSTTELDTSEVSRVYDVLNRFTAERFGISVLFPSRFGND